jgi:sec-independent protein translocase protein TatB
VFGISFGELMLIATVALLVVGPQKLPQMLRTLGNWIARLRRMMTDVRSQSGIDDILRSEGLEGGLSELRSIMKGAGGLPLAARAFQSAATSNPSRRASVEAFAEDRSREYPVEGPDAQGALPEDLLPKPPKPAGSGDERLVVPAGAAPPQPATAAVPEPTSPSGIPRPDRPRTIPPKAAEGDKTAASGPQPALEAVSSGRQAS